MNLRGRHQKRLGLDVVNILGLSIVREHTLSFLNRVLIVMIWLRAYSFLSAMFFIEKDTVKKEIKNLLNIFERRLSIYVSWPTIDEWLEHCGDWKDIKVAVGAIDGTSHKIYRPGIEPQEQYYSGHRCYHAIHTQVVVDTKGIIRHTESGFLRHQNDAQQFMLMHEIGTDLPFPDDCFLLGNKIYPNGHPILTPYTEKQLARKQSIMRDKSLKLNRYIRKYRVTVEHTIRELKCYRSVAATWRHKRPLLSQVVSICASLLCRRKDTDLLL